MQECEHSTLYEYSIFPKFQVELKQANSQNYPKFQVEFKQANSQCSRREAAG